MILNYFGCYKTYSKSLVDSHAPDCPRIKLPEFIRPNSANEAGLSGDEKPQEGLGGDFYCPNVEL